MTSPPLLVEPVPPYGAVIAAHPLVRRIVANNPGPMTCHGTSTWIVGRGRVAVIDPGPDDAAHRAALLAALSGETVTHVLLTHGHSDHAAGADAFADAVGAATHGFRPPGPAGAVGQPFRPEVALGDGDVVEGPGWRLEAIHTPGHASDHLCFALAGEGVLFSGDHVMGWSTSVVSPPDGDMAAYMRSLSRLVARDEALFLPGHGPAIADPIRHTRALLDHRLAREAAVLAAVREGLATPEAIVRRLYPGLAAALQRPAARSVLAHLLKLAAEGAVLADQAGGETFRAAN